MVKRCFFAALKIIGIMLAVLVVIGAVHLAEAYIHRETIEVHAFDYASPKISAALDGFKIAFLTDIHVANQADKARLERAVELVERQEPDLLLLGGDFTNGSETQAKTAYQLLAGVNPPHGIYAVLGNHDLGDIDVHLMAESGIRCLENQGARIVPGLYLGGVEDLWRGSPDVQTAIAGRGADDFVLLLSHNPDVARDRDVTGVDLMLSGHTHGGLVNVMGLWSPAARHVTRYGNRFVKGLVHDITDVFISNGLGDSAYPRVFARRQVNVITLRAQ